LYSPEIPVVSIPLSEYNDSTRWLALAHETGHHFFWNSLRYLEDVEKLHFDMAKSLAEALARPEKTLEPWGQWMEETFADVCGVLLAGPGYVVSSQERAAEKIKKPEDLAHNDGEHPIPFLRPIITYQALCEIADPSLQPFLTEVSRRWDEFCAGAENLECTVGRDKKIPLATLRAEAASVVSAMLRKPIWPGGKALVELIQRSTTSMIPREALESLPQPPAQTLIVKELREEDIPETIRDVWNFLVKRIHSTKTALAGGEELSRWNVLVSLSIQDDHGHADLGAHSDCLFHYWAPLAWWHRHEAGTGAPGVC
ncbi:MAG: hypothetical protein AB1649_24115, partial [Chloroflexota bacterium]